MSNTRSDPLASRIAAVVSALAQTPDHALAAYRSRHASDRDLDVTWVAEARAIVDAVGFALLSDDPNNWRRVHKAWEILRRNTRPEAPPPAAAPVEPVAALSPTERAPSVETTLLSGAALRAAEASAAEASPAPRAAAQQASPWAVAQPPVVRVKPVLDETKEHTAFDLDGPLPFKPGDARPPPVMIEDLPPSGRGATLASGGHVDGTTLPFEMPFVSLSEPRSMTMEQYASLSAELQRAPLERHEAIAGRYRLGTQKAQHALHEQWRERLAANEGLRTKFAELMASYIEWLNTPDKKT